MIEIFVAFSQFQARKLFLEFVTPFIATLLLTCLPCKSLGNDDPLPTPEWRWMGHDFAFCFVTDDGRSSNIAWADTAREMGFRFTIAINSGIFADTILSSEDVRELISDGFEIGQHGYSHGFEGLPQPCSVPPRGSLAGYFLCDDIPHEEAMGHLAVEISRDSLARFANVPVQEIKTAAYPRHRHTRALIDSLVSEGYIGARMGSKWDFDRNGYGDFLDFPKNGWDEGISLFRIPIAGTEAQFFGNHSANPPVHFSPEEFVNAALPKISAMRASGGLFVLYSHHLGDDNDSMGDVNYGSGGLTKANLAWMANLVREQGGIILTLKQAVEYYRSRTVMSEVDGDLVWAPGSESPVPDILQPRFGLLNYPNPFNPRTNVHFSLEKEMLAKLTVYSLKGEMVKVLANGIFPEGDHRLVWDGCDDSLTPVSAGIYSLVLEADGVISSRKIVLLK